VSPQYFANLLANPDDRVQHAGILVNEGYFRAPNFAELGFIEQTEIAPTEENRIVGYSRRVRQKA
jgi:hypothetical protein